MLRRRMRNIIHRVGDMAEGDKCHRMTPTLLAILLTAAIAASWPGVLAYFSWRLAAADSPELCKAFSAGLAATARCFSSLELLRAICRPKGLGELHLGWSGENLRVLRRHIKWLTAAALPLVFVVAALHAEENERWGDSLGRLCFIAALLCFAAFVERALRPSRGVFRDFLAARRGGWMDRTRYLWYPAAALLPLTLAGMAVAGYYYTSQQLAARMVVSIYLLLGLILLRRSCCAGFASTGGRSPTPRCGSGWPPTSDRQACGGRRPPRRRTAEYDLATINIQTRRLVEYSLALAGMLLVWFVWVDVLPALGMLNRVEIWHGHADHRDRRAGRRRRAPPRARSKLGRRHAGRPRAGRARPGHHAHRREKHPRPAGNGRLAAPAARCRRALRRGHRLALRDHRSWAACSASAASAWAGRRSSGWWPP